MPKTQPCPFCQEGAPGDRGVLVNRVGKVTSSITGWFQRTLGIRIPISSVIQYMRERSPVPKEEIIEKCGYCKNERIIEDPNDDTEIEFQVAVTLTSQADKIAELEALL